MPKSQRAGRRTSKYRFELLIPSSYNDGRPVETEKIQRVRRTLIAKFGGCRVQPAAPYQGWWIHQNRTYEDWLVLFTIESDRTEANLRWFEKLKNQKLLRDFEQEEIYLAVSNVTWLEK